MKYSPMAAILLTLLPGAALAEETEGTYENTLDVLYAVTQQGSPDPAGDGYCQETFGQHLGSTVSGTYKVDTTTFMMSATAVYEGSEAAMFPLGIQGRYAFMTDGVPEALQALHVNRILLNLSTDFETKESDILFTGNDSYNCMLSNHAAN